MFHVCRRAKKDERHGESSWERQRQKPKIYRDVMGRSRVDDLQHSARHFCERLARLRWRSIISLYIGAGRGE